MTDLEYRVPSPHYLRLTLEDRALCLTSPDDPILSSTKLCVKPSPSGILYTGIPGILEFSISDLVSFLSIFCDTMKFTLRGVLFI